MGAHITICLQPPIPCPHQVIKLLLLQPLRLFLSPLPCRVVPERSVPLASPLLHVSEWAGDVNTVWPRIDFLLLGLLSKWPRCCYLCWCVGLRGRSQKARDVSVLFFIGSCACHLWVLLLCFLVCFDVFGVLFFGNHAISLRADDLLVEQSSEERR